MSATRRLAEAEIERYPDEAARILEEFAPAQVSAFLAEVPPGFAAPVLGRLSPPMAAAAVAAMALARAAERITLLHPGAAAGLLRRVPAGLADAVLSEAPAEFARAVRRSLAARADSAGALMDPAVLALAEDMTAGATIEAVRRQAAALGPCLYLVDREGRLTGMLDTGRLIAAAPEARLGDLMDRRVARLHIDDPAEAVLAHPGWSQWQALPVVDGRGVFAGAVKQQDLARLRHGGEAGPGALALALGVAEVFWVAMRGITDGLVAVGRGAVKPAERADAG